MSKDETINNIEDLKKQESKLLGDLSFVYLQNKKYFILVEETLSSLKFYLAPLIQHRDALDHIMRAYQVEQEQNNDVLKQLKNRVRQLDKALGHELRAFFDVADFICIKIRLYIADKLRRVSSKKIVRIWSDYNQKRQRIFEISENISNVRQYRGASLESVNEYSEILDELFSIYKKFYLEVEPKLHRKWFLGKKTNNDSSYYRIGG